MKIRRSLALAAATLVAAAIVPVTSTVSAHHDPAGAVDCVLNGFVVKDPTNIAGTGAGVNGSGFFGAAKVAGNPVPSSVTCSGTINGTATVSGSFVWCAQLTDHNPDTNPSAQWKAANHNHATWAVAQSHNGTTNHGPAHQRPTKFNCNGAAGSDTADEALYPSHVAGQEHPTNVHVIGTGNLTGGLVWNGVDGNPAPGNCSFNFQGHALAPPRLDVNINCGGHTFSGDATAGFATILGTAGDSFGHATDSTQDPEPCATWAQRELGSSQDPRCFRAVIFSGDIAASNPAV